MKPIKDKVTKKNKCRGCGNLFQPVRPLQTVCNWNCAIQLLTKKKQIKAKQAEKIARRQNREAKVKLKTKSDWLKEAQIEFNKYCRLRDKDLPCICCDRSPDTTDWMGGIWDAGHYLSRGAFPELRFNEDNCHKQLKSCNGGSGKYAKKGRTVNDGYRTNLITKIGLERVAALEGKHPPLKLSIDEIKGIKALYKQKCKELECMTDFII